MLRIFLTTLALCLLAEFSVAAGDFVATVNGEGISRQRVQGGVEAMMKRQGLNFGGMTDPKQYQHFEKQVLDTLIEQELLWQEASRKNYTINEAELAAAVDGIKGRFQSKQEFTTQLKISGLTEAAFRENLKRQLSVSNFVDAEVTAKLAVDDAEVDRFYQANTERMQRPEQVHARHILIKLPPNASESAQQSAKARLDEIRKAAEAGADFSELARTHSQGPSAAKGGDLGFFGRGQMVPPFERVAFALKPGELSDVVRTNFGYHIIRLEARREAGIAPKDEVADGIRDYLREQKTGEKLAALVTELRAKAEVKETLP